MTTSDSIGGSGLYKLSGLTTIKQVKLTTPWGAPSSPVTLAALPSGQPIAFIARHGIGHVLTPSEVPSRANIAALKHLGVEAIVAFSAVGSLREDVKPRDIVVPNQIIDRTKGIRPSTFFEGLGVVAHAMFGEPFDTQLSALVAQLIRDDVATFPAEDRIGVHEDKVVVCMEGPQFSTRAESNMYRQWGGDIINMSVIPEAKLAREAELSYALVAQITDYDAWRVNSEPVTVQEVMATVGANVAVSNKLSLTVLAAVHDAVAAGKLTLAKGGMTYSVMCPKEAMSAEARQKLGYILPALA